MVSTQYYKPQRPSLDGTEGEQEELLLASPSGFLATSGRCGRIRVRLQKHTSAFKDILIFGLAIAALVTYAWRPAINVDSEGATENQKQTPLSILAGCDCGRSIKEAKELGCKFDTLASAWLPSHCRDSELTAQFDRAGDGPNGTWTYWLDRQKTRAISIEELAALADTPEAVFYNSHRWHIVHCMYYWRKAVRARRLGTTVEPRYNSEGHAAHCAQMLDLDGSEYMTATSVTLNSNLN
ncbi:hypothetical protein NLG97_g2017 [Lecanicillium saksenae]|uniref:Uncharacterized protein n=1 Tax=Lecanicillium saksenae TaxID=468837 RepID=A0ACC1R3Z2_9HYPO|nr:hypothetical protein NLG97_g2017 [Lecanicillium saksenae]